MTRLEEVNWMVKCQNLMQSVNSNDYSLRRLETLGRHGNKRPFRSNLEDFSHWILYLFHLLNYLFDVM